MLVVWEHLSRSPSAKKSSLPAPRTPSGALVPPLGKGLSISHHHQSIFMDGRSPATSAPFCICLLSSHFRWKWQYSTNRKKFLRQSFDQLWGKGKHVSPLPHERRDLRGLDLHQGQESLTPSSPPASTGIADSMKISFFLLLGPRPRWVQRGRNCRNGSFLQHHSTESWLTLAGLVAHPAPLWSLMSCLLCLASWMPGLPGANWDTGDLHVTPVPFHSSPRLELEAAGRICQPRVMAPTSWSWLVPTSRSSCPAW